MTRRRRVLALAAVVVALVASACTSAAPRADVGSVAPTFSTFDLNGKPVKLTDYRGNTVILNFWASWCVPCREEFPHCYAQMETRPRVAVLGVVVKDTIANAKKFIATHGGTWPGLQDNGKIAKAYGIGPGLPSTIVIGPAGLIVRRKIGQIRTLTDLLPLYTGTTSR